MDYKHYKADAARKRQLTYMITKELESCKGVEFAYLFGSFTGDSPVFRDIDLGVYYQENDHLETFDMALSLAVQLTKKTTIPVDVRVLNDAPVTFLYKVIKGELIFEKNKNLRCKLMENTIREYLDIKPILYRAMKEAYS